MITVDFMPKNHGIVCENCIHQEKCPYDYVCPTIKRILDEQLIEQILEEIEE